MAHRHASVALGCSALTALTALTALAALSSLVLGCAALTRPDGEPRPDPAAAPKVAALEAPRAPAPQALDVVPLDPAPGRIPVIIPGTAHRGPAAAATAGGG